MGVSTKQERHGRSHKLSNITMTLLHRVKSPFRRLPSSPSPHRSRHGGSTKEVRETTTKTKTTQETIVSATELPPFEAVWNCDGIPDIVSVPWSSSHDEVESILTLDKAIREPIDRPLTPVPNRRTPKKTRKLHRYMPSYRRGTPSSPKLYTDEDWPSDEEGGMKSKADVPNKTSKEAEEVPFSTTFELCGLETFFGPPDVPKHKFEDDRQEVNVGSQVKTLASSGSRSGSRSGPRSGSRSSPRDRVEYSALQAERRDPAPDPPGGLWVI